MLQVPPTSIDDVYRTMTMNGVKACKFLLLKQEVKFFPVCIWEYELHVQQNNNLNYKLWAKQIWKTRWHFSFSSRKGSLRLDIWILKCDNKSPNGECDGESRSERGVKANRSHRKTELGIFRYLHFQVKMVGWTKFHDTWLQIYFYNIDFFCVWKKKTTAKTRKLVSYWDLDDIFSVGICSNVAATVPRIYWINWNVCILHKRVKNQYRC